MNIVDIMNKAIIWGRVSTTVQEIEAQVNELRLLALSKGYDDVYVIQSKGASAIKQNDLYREEVDLLLNTLKTNTEYKTVFVWEISRLARVESTFHLIKEFLVQNKIQLYVKNPELELLDSDGNEKLGVSLAFSMLATLARQEMSIKQARFKRGKTTAKAQGRFVGGKLAFGYVTDHNGYIKPQERDSETVRYIFNEYVNTDKGCNVIYKDVFKKGYLCRKVYKYSSMNSAIVRILKNRKYIGEDNYPQIVDKETFEKAQIKLSKRNKPRQKKHLFLSTGLLIDTDGYKYFGCYDKRAYKNEKTLQCVSLNGMDSIIWDAAIILNDFYQDGRIDELHEEYVRKFNEAIVEFGLKNEEVKDIEQQKEKLNTLFIRGRIRNELYESQYKELEKREIKLKGELAKCASQNEQLMFLIDSTSRASAELNNMSIEAIETSQIDDNGERYDIIHQVVEKALLRKIRRGEYIITIFNKVGYLKELEYHYISRGRTITITRDNENINMIKTHP